MWKHMFIIISGALAAKETNVQYMLVYNKPVVGRTAHTISIVLTSFYNLLPSIPPFSLCLVVCNLHIR